jgi:threonine dehydrogenase-like Zn-dependent dehydrogenase
MGQGLVGNLAAQLAALQGATVYAVDIDDKRLDLATSCGIANTINSSQSEWQEKFMENTGGAHTLIDATGNSAVIESALNIIRPYGECILLGSPRAAHETNVTDTFNKIHLPPFVTMKGALEWRFPTFEDEFVKHSLVRNSKIIMGLIADGRLHVKPLLTQQLPPEEAPAAYSALQQKNNEYVGVEFNWK